MSKWRDPYLWIDADVLQNNFGIKTQHELEQYESNFTLWRLIKLEANPISGNFDLLHLQEIHKYLFQDVYPFAGQIRTINISKDEMFADAREITRLSQYLFTKLHRENYLANLSETQFAERAALYMNAINVIHPFREGNGRTQRFFIEQLAYHAGHTLDLSAISNKTTMVEASKQGFSTDIDGVIAFDTQRPTLFIDMFQKAINQMYADIIRKARLSLEKETANPDLLPFIDVKPGLTVQGLVLARNEDFTAHMHSMKWVAVHKNEYLRKPIHPGELAIVKYNEAGFGEVTHMGRAIEFHQPNITHLQLEKAKLVTRTDSIYHGKLIHLTEQHVFQDIGRNNFIKHDRTLFPQKHDLIIGTQAAIKYEHGKVNVILQPTDQNINLSKNTVPPYSDNDVKLNTNLLDSIKEYIYKNVMLNQKLVSKNENIGINLSATKIYANEALALDKDIISKAKELLNDNSGQSLLKTQAATNISRIRNQDEFQEFHEKATKNSLTKQDILAVLNHAKYKLERVNAYSIEQSKGRTR